MIVVELVKNGSTGFLERFIITGHAGYDEKGKDIVCSAMSILSFSTVKALERQYKAFCNEGEGLLDCTIYEPDSASNLLTMAFVEGVHELAEQYSNYVTWHLTTV